MSANLTNLLNASNPTETLGFVNYVFSGWFYAILLFALVIVLFVWFTQLQFSTIRALLFSFLLTFIPAIFLRLIEAFDYPFIPDEYIIFHIIMVITLAILEKASQSR